MYGFYPVFSEAGQSQGLSLYAFCIFFIPVLPIGLYLAAREEGGFRFYGSIPFFD